MLTGRSALSRVACLIACVSLDAGTAAQRDQRLRTNTAAVVVDVVVRDQKGRPVTDLRKEDFEIYEDGIRQELGDVTLVMPHMSQPSDRPGEIGPVRVPAEPAGIMDPRAKVLSVVALVFDRLSPEARAFSHKAALAYLDTLQPGDFAGVFLSDLSLTTIQGFTSDRDELRRGVNKVGATATAAFDRDAIRDPSQTKAEGDFHPSVPAVASAESPGRPAPRERGVASGGPLTTVTSRSEAIWEEMARDQQGYATTDALLALSAGLGSLPGRKSIVLFAEGISIPPAVLPAFQNVVVTANRSNVSIYTVDAAGLRVHSSDQATAREVRAIGDANLRAATERDTGGRPLTATLEQNEDVLRRDPRTSLTLLAQQTGGFLIDETNDLQRGLQNLDLDRRFHYLLTYTSQKQELTGEWRTLQVRVPTRSVTVRNRAGYLAVPAGTRPVLAHEGPALAALNRTPPPAALAVSGGAFVFPNPGTPEARVAVLVGADVSALGQKAGVDKGSKGTHFTILARLKDATGQVVRQASQAYSLNATTPLGEVLFFRQPTLPPGAYLLEYVLHDAVRQRAGTGTTSVIVPDGSGGQPRLSSLVIVRRTERVPLREQKDTNPLYYGDLLLYPNLGEPLSKARTPTVSFAFSVIPGTAPVRASLMLSEGERALGETTLPLGAPDKQGVIWHVGQLPLNSLPPSEYRLTVVVTANGHSETRRATFRTIE